MTLTQIKPAGLSKPVDLADNEKIRLGTGNDLEIYHNGTANYIKGVNNQFIYLGTNNTNRWSIANDGHIRPEANQTYDIGSSVQQVNQVYAKEFVVRDNGYLKAGNSADLQIYHNGTSSYISNTTGNLYITATSTETAIQIIPNGAVDLRYDGSKKLETTASGVDVTGYLKASTYLWTDTALYSDQWISKSQTNGHDMYIYSRNAAGNNVVQAEFKIGQGATFYHNSYRTLQTVDGGIRVYGKEGGSGHVYIQADEGDDNADQWVLRAADGSSELKIRNSASGYWEESIVMDGNGAVELYYDNSKKLETLSTGAKVSGNLQLSPGNNTDAVIYNTDAGGLKYQADDHGHMFQTYSGSWLTRLYIADDGKISTGGEAAPDVSAGGLCLHQGSESANILSFKSSDINHGRTSTDQTDTWFSIRKVSDNKGGAYIRGYTDQSGGDPGIHIAGYIDSQAPSYRAIQLTGARKNTGGNTGSSPFTSGNPIVRISNDFDTTVASFTPDGLAFNDDTAAANSLGDYEEGTWTPSVHNGGGSLTTVVARYTKIGRLVHIQAYVNYTTANSTSAFQMGGLPFACLGNDYNTCVTDFGRGGKKGAYSRTHTGNTFMEFLYSSESTSSDRITLKGNQIGSSYIIVSNTYMTS